MARCPSCDYPLPEDRARLGARCPSCRNALYEPPTRFGRPLRPGEAACTVHPENESIDTCARCGNFFCEICRCRWRDQLLCSACVERALESSEAAPHQERAHFVQSLMGLLAGIGAWVLAGLGIIVGGLLANSSPQGLIAGSLLIVAALGCAALAALFGVGLSAAALRARGNHMIMAASGLFLSGLLFGLVSGFIAYNLYTQMG
jgi:hypothetical protein